jgi:hypothetical protein
MCTVVTLVGCTGVGLVTLNFGSLARYRVPFLPFYGSLVLVLVTRPEKATAAAAVASTPLTRRQQLRAQRPRRRFTSA